ncbi:MAG: folylpolyglutamate synthase/dihydrofolate synthase family protein [Thermodesulfovibrionales bacterium]|nr:folylpolyglutamate synthase/dihydrofolate synthase family protein [Thermodesulfovibrionales bacterium]
MSYRDAVQYLYSLQKYGIKFGLENITRLAALLDNPHESFLSVHVAGTNGKGSTSAMIASILQAAGFRTGLFTSPHLVSFTERIRINSQEIKEHEVIDLSGEIRERVLQCNDFSPTFFEVVTALALLYFKRKQVDIAVFETGMGGRLDATNIIHPMLTVITTISYDHKEFLGARLEEIAREKAGIIKSGIPVVSSRQEPEAERVLKEKTGKENTEISFYGHDFSSVLKQEETGGIRFDYRQGKELSLNDLFVPLPGEHQMENASVAIKAVELCSQHLSFLKPLGRENSGLFCSINHQSIREGLNAVSWPGRLQLFHGFPPVVLDGAHNPSAATVLARALERTFLKKYQNIILVLGVMDDKDIRGIMEPLLPIASGIILTAPDYRRAAKPDKLERIAQSLGYSNLTAVPTVHQALDIAKALAVSLGDDSLVVVTGSFYTIGEASEVLGNKGVLTDLRE